MIVCYVGRFHFLIIFQTCAPSVFVMENDIKYRNISFPKIRFLSNQNTKISSAIVRFLPWLPGVHEVSISGVINKMVELGEKEWQRAGQMCVKWRKMEQTQNEDNGPVCAKKRCVQEWGNKFSKTWLGWSLCRVRTGMATSLAVIVLYRHQNEHWFTFTNCAAKTKVCVGWDSPLS